MSRRDSAVDMNYDWELARDRVARQLLGRLIFRQAARRARRRNAELDQQAYVAAHNDPMELDDHPVLASELGSVNRVARNVRAQFTSATATSRFRERMYRAVEAAADPLGHGTSATIASYTYEGMQAMDTVREMNGLQDGLRLSQTKTMGIRNSQAGRASSSKKGSVKLSAKKKPVRVSKELAKKVKKVMDGQDYRGTYLTDKQMYIDFKTSSAAGSAASPFDLKIPNIGSLTNQYSNSFIGTGLPGRVCQWWGAGQANGVGVVPAGFDFTHFSPLKIIDAASVLWNKKFRSADYSIQTGNLTIDADTSGNPDNGTAALPEKKNFKIHVENSYCKFLIKNTCQRRMLITFYHCTQKQKFADDTPLTVFHESIVQELGGVNLDNGGILEAKNSDNLNQNIANYALNPSFEPNALPSFNNMYKYQKTIVNIGPGETHEHAVQGPKGYDLDFSKLWNGIDDKAGAMYKATTVQTMIKMELDQAFTKTIAFPHYAPTNFPSVIPTADYQCPLSITLKENYTLRCPKISGFLTRSVAVNTPQTLNLKKKSFAALNVGSTPGSGFTLQGVFDEEQPGTQIAASAFV